MQDLYALIEARVGERRWDVTYQGRDAAEAARQAIFKADYQRWLGSRVVRVAITAIPAEVLAALKMALPTEVVGLIVDASADGVVIGEGCLPCCPEEKRALHLVAAKAPHGYRDSRPAALSRVGGALELDDVWNLAQSLVQMTFAALEWAGEGPRWSNIIRQCAALCDARQVLDELGVRPVFGHKEAIEELGRVGLLEPMLAGLAIKEAAAGPRRPLLGPQ